jgi:hypothetical protein
MTVDFDDEQDDAFRASLASLRHCDVSHSRARKLRRRCHAILQTDPSLKRSAWMVDGASFRRVAIPALGAAWCLAYLAEIVRYSVAISAYFASQ